MFSTLLIHGCCLHSGELKSFSFNVDAMRKNNKFTESRLSMADRAAQKHTESQGVIRETVQLYRCRSNNKSEQDWLDVNFLRPSAMLADEWAKIERSLRAATVYQPVTTSELADIVKSFRSEFCKHVVTAYTFRSDVTSHSTYGPLLQVPEWAYICHCRRESIGTVKRSSTCRILICVVSAEERPNKPSVLSVVQ